MLITTRRAAEEDLAALKPPRGLTRPLFVSYISSVMSQTTLFSSIDHLAESGISDSKAHLFIEEQLGEDAPYSPQDTWQVIKAWLTYFKGSSYRLETREDVLIKGQQLSP